MPTAGFRQHQRQPRYSKEEFAVAGLKFINLRYVNKSMNRAIVVGLSRLPPVGYANDIETGEFELADDTMMATRQLYDRLPDAQPWVIRIGYRAVRRFGARSLKDIL